MAKVGGPKQPIRRKTIPTGQKLQNDKLQQNRELGLQGDVNEAKSSMLDEGAQSLKTKKDTEVDKPKEKVTLTSLQAEKTEAQDGDAQADAQKTAQEPVQPEGPKEKTSAEFQEEFFGAFTQNLDSDTQQSIGKKAHESLQRLSDGGKREVNANSVFAAETYNHARREIGKKMPKASQKEIREAAKNDPELAKNVQLLDSSAAYLTAVQKETAQAKAQANATGDGVSAESATPVGDGGGTVPPSDGSSATGAASADPFAAGRSLSEGGQQQQQPPGDAEKPFYHRSPVEQAELIRERNSQMNEIMKIYNEMAQENRKAAAERHALMQQTNQEIYDIFMSIYVNRQRSLQGHNATYLKLITEAWG
jgi:hypothetical protein